MTTITEAKAHLATVRFLPETADVIAWCVAEIERLSPRPLPMEVREAARRRSPLGGADVQALEHAITMTERERDAAIRERDARPAIAPEDAALVELEVGGDMGAYERVGAALRAHSAKAVTPAEQAPADVSRCAICDWPIKQTIEEGCTVGSCSYRPAHGSPEHRRIALRRRELAAKAGDR